MQMGPQPIQPDKWTKKRIEIIGGNISGISLRVNAPQLGLFIHRRYLDAMKYTTCFIGMAVKISDVSLTLNMSLYLSALLYRIVLLCGIFHENTRLSDLQIPRLCIVLFCYQNRECPLRRELFAPFFCSWPAYA